MNNSEKLVENVRVLTGVLGGYGILVGILLLMVGLFAGPSPFVGGLVHFFLGLVIVILGRKASTVELGAASILMALSLFISIACCILVAFAVQKSLPAAFFLLLILVLGFAIAFYSFKILQCRRVLDEAQASIESNPPDTPG